MASSSGVQLPTDHGPISVESLERALLDWATQEMKFDSTPYMAGSNFVLPSQNDMKLLCQGPMINVWKHIVQHVKSVKTVDNIKRNLALHQQKSAERQPRQGSSLIQNEEDGVQKLQKLKCRLETELSTINSEVELLEKEYDHSKDELAELELRYQSVCHRVRNLQKKESFLSVAGGCALDTMEKYKEYSNRISQRTADVLFRGLDFQEDECYLEAEKDDTKDLESESCRDVRTTCDEVCQMLHDTLGGRFTSDQKALEKAQSELWSKVQKTASSRRIVATVRALVSNTVKSSGNMRDDTVRLNIAQDALDLSFSYKSSGKLEDISTPPAVQKSVQQLLLASNEEHVLRFFKEQEYKNESWKLEAQLDNMMAQIHKQIHKTLAEHARNVPLAKSYVDSLISAAVERSVVPCLRTELDSLVERIQKAKQEKEILHSKHARIQDFKLAVEKKQTLITALARQNTNAPDRLGEQRKQVLSYIDSHSMPSHGTATQQMCEGLKDSLISEVEKFSLVPLPCMLSVQLDSTTRVGVTDLSLAPSQHPLVREKMHMFKKLCHYLEFPVYKSSDKLASHILHLHRELHRLKTAQQHRDQQVKSVKRSTHCTDDIQAILDLCGQTRQYTETQTQKMLPRLEKCQNILHTLAAEVELANNGIRIWGEQPAQFTTPWVTTEGWTFDQWLHKWRVAVTQVHKMMAQTPHK